MGRQLDGAIKVTDVVVVKATVDMVDVKPQEEDEAVDLGIK